MRFISLFCVMLALLMVQAQDTPANENPVSNDNPVTVTSQAFVVSQTTNEDGSTSEELVEATEARPGQIIEYQLTVTNNGDTSLPDSAVSVYGPVPEGTRAIENSGTPNSNTVQQEFLNTDEYRGWRWTVIRSFAPEEVITLKYRVVME